MNRGMGVLVVVVMLGRLEPRGKLFGMRICIFMVMVMLMETGEGLVKGRTKSGIAWERELLSIHLVVVVVVGGLGGGLLVLVVVLLMQLVIGLDVEGDTDKQVYKTRIKERVGMLYC